MGTNPNGFRSKPDTSEAMNDLIFEVRQAIDFDLPKSRLCHGPCTGCSKKLMEFLDTELEEWEYKLAQEETPSFGDIRSLAKKSKKIYGVLKINGIVEDPTSTLIASS